MDIKSNAHVFTKLEFSSDTRELDTVENMEEELDAGIRPLCIDVLKEDLIEDADS